VSVTMRTSNWQQHAWQLAQVTGSGVEGIVLLGITVLGIVTYFFE
jgi:hypothetical protein